MDQSRVGIVLIHEVWGVTAALQRKADALRACGYRVEVPDLYGGESTNSYRQAVRLRSALTVDQIHHDLTAAIDRVRMADAQRLAVIGYSMGGAIALWAARTLDIDLAVTYYGGGLTKPYWKTMPPGIELAAALTVPWCGFYGGRDSVTPPDALAALIVAAERAPVSPTVEIFPEAGHGFALDPADRRYLESAARQADSRVVDALATLATE